MPFHTENIDAMMSQLNASGSHDISDIDTIIDDDFLERDSLTNQCIYSFDHLYRRPRFFSDVNRINHFMDTRSEEHTSELQSRFELVCRLLLEKKTRQAMR